MWLLLAFMLSGLNDGDCKNTVEELYHKYKRLMFASANRYTDNPADQEDIVQTALERLIKLLSAPSQKSRCISAGYIVTIVRSVSIELLRKQGREAKHCVCLEPEQLEQIVETGEPMDRLVLLSEEAEQLWRVWPLLPGEDRFLLEGKYLLGYSDRQLAASLGCNPDSIRMKLTRARRRAMKLLPERESS